MSDAANTGVLYTNHVPRRTSTALLSVWSYATHAREAGRAAVVTNAAGEQEFWLDQSDPLLNSILPGTAVSIVHNFGGLWASGRSLVATSLVPRSCVIGPFTHPRLLRVGTEVRAVGVVVPVAVASHIFGVAPAALVDRILPLAELWPSDPGPLDGDPSISLQSALDALIGRILQCTESLPSGDTVVRRAVDAITRARGTISIDSLADSLGLSRQHFSRRFRGATGMAPKLFARITRFQALVHALLVHDVSHWVGVAADLGFTDQAHMINEFRQLAGQSPTHFFRPHDTQIGDERVKVRGRPSEWLRRP